ncbi:hypothetical protein EDB85DRAFT_1899510 [Lactarius pseudohatsudake]|nr:hypothetical protein EDB85DRAFT_1899510 [Lactarius pseudohatsudake]
MRVIDQLVQISTSRCSLRNIAHSALITNGQLATRQPEGSERAGLANALRCLLAQYGNYLKLSQISKYVHRRDARLPHQCNGGVMRATRRGRRRGGDCMWGHESMAASSWWTSDDVEPGAWLGDLGNVLVMSQNLGGLSPPIRGQKRNNLVPLPNFATNDVGSQREIAASPSEDRAPRDAPGGVKVALIRGASAESSFFFWKVPVPCWDRVTG